MMGVGSGSQKKPKIQLVAKKESPCGSVDILLGMDHMDVALREHEWSRGLVLY
jgi:hypothetical protein